MFLAILVATSVVAGALVYRTATSGEPSEQRLAFGVIGSVLGILWSHFSKLVESATAKRS